MSLQLEVIEKFDFLPFEGPLNMTNPDATFKVYEDHGRKKQTHIKTITPPEHIYFGRLLVRGSRALISKFDLKKRAYLGVTSMDAELSLVMANQALVKKGSFVYDPFVGTGSFLFTCAEFGAYVMGSDIDGRPIRGKSGCNVDANVKQYGLSNRVLGTVICDIAHHPWKEMELWDAIVCDPPYGVRAGARKIGSNVPLEVPVKPIKANGEPKYPDTVPYSMDRVIVDLLDFAAKYLVSGGRLVYWLPTVTEQYQPIDVPTHPCLKLVSNSSQCFGKWSRRLITMEKLPPHMRTHQDTSTYSHEPAHARFREKYFTAGK